MKRLALALTLTLCPLMALNPKPSTAAPQKKAPAKTAAPKATPSTATPSTAAPRKTLAQPFVIADEGVARATIVLAAGASAPEKHAAEELASFLGQVTGAQIQMAAGLNPSGANICVGIGAARLADSRFTTDGLGMDGLVMRTAGRNLILAGGEPRGTLYAVYTFLEDYVGCHWWSPKASTIPRKPSLSITPLNVRYVPQFEHRDILIAPMTNDPDWSVRSKLNGELNGYGKFDIMPERGGVQKQHPPGHSYFYVMPPEKYFADHPEWYSLIEGKRQADPSVHASLCLSNSALQDQFEKNLINGIREAPQMYASAAPFYAGWIAKSPQPFTYASVTPPDDAGYPNRCQCDVCEAINREEGSPAGLMLRFANRMARSVKKEFPWMSVTTFAYHYNQKPPKITKPDPNVVVYYCPINASFSRPLTAEANKRWLDDYIGWTKICKRVYLYDYPDNCVYEQVPHPNLYVLADNIRWSAEHGVKGYFGDGYNGLNGGTEMAELRGWMVAKLLWKPESDPKQLIAEFTNGYYGAAAPQVRAYLDTMQKAVVQSGDWLDLGSPPTARFLSVESLTEGLSHLQAAEAAVKDDPVLLKRVQNAELPPLYVFLVRWNELKELASNRQIAWPLPDKREDAYAQFDRIMKENNIALSGPSAAELDKAGVVRTVRDGF